MSRLTPSQTVYLVVFTAFGLVVYFFVSSPGLFSKLQVIVWHNLTFWAACVFGFVYALICKLRYPKEISWLEIPAQVAATSVALFLFYSLFFYAFTDLHDTEIWNSYVTRVEYWEEWTEEIEHEEQIRDKNGRVVEVKKWTEKEYHPPEWKLITDAGEAVLCNETVYRNYVARFKNQKKENIYRSDQLSIGDGDMFYTVYNGERENLVPTAVEHRFVNYLKGSSSIRKRTGGSTRGFEKLLLAYPRVKDSQFGYIDIDRVLVAGSSVPKEWTADLNWSLSRSLSYLGKAKQVNIIVYIAGTPDQAFLHALEEHWVNGKKNDVIVLIGAPHFPSIAWASIMAWTDSEEFKIILRNKILDLSVLPEKGEDLGKIIAEQISLPAEQGGFKRLRMRDLEYLAADVTLGWGAQTIVLLLSAGVAWLISWALRNN